MSLSSEPSDARMIRIRVGSSLAEAERQLILATLEACHGNKSAAAKVLGISLKTLYNRLNGYSSEVDALRA